MVRIRCYAPAVLVAVLFIQRCSGHASEVDATDKLQASGALLFSDTPAMFCSNRTSSTNAPCEEMGPSNRTFSASSKSALSFCNEQLGSAQQKNIADPHTSPFPSSLFQMTGLNDTRDNSTLSMDHPSTETFPVVAAYLPSWIAYKTPPTSPLSYLDEISKLSHLIYCFANIDPETGSVTFSMDPYAHYEWTITDGKDAIYGNIQALKQIKTMYPALKLGFSVGGYDGSKKYTDILSKSGRRVEVANSIKRLLVRDFPFFDFVDIDWESMNTSVDALYLSEILLLLKQMLNGTEKEITMAIPASIAERITQEKGFPHQQVLDSCVDLFFLMAFDYCGEWSKLSGHHAPLSMVQRSLASAMELLDHRKIVLGLPVYGRVFYNCTGVGQPFANYVLNSEEEDTPSDTESSRFSHTSAWDDFQHEDNLQETSVEELKQKAPKKRSPKFPDAFTDRHPIEKKTGITYLYRTIPYSRIIELISENPELIVETQLMDGAYLSMKNATHEATPSLVITYNSKADIMDKIHLAKTAGIGGVFFWEITNDHGRKTESLFSLFKNKN